MRASAILPETMINPIKIIDQDFWQVSAELFPGIPKITPPE
jgi:hypothetical protein